MSGHKSWDQLRDEARRNPERSARIDAYVSAFDAALRNGDVTMDAFEKALEAATTGTRTCPACNGDGWFYQPLDWPDDGSGDDSIRCEVCDGGGVVE